MTDLSSLQARLGILFRNKSLLCIALTHRSWLNENPSATPLRSSTHAERFTLSERSEPKGDNERLEFLGDAIVDFVAAEFLYRRFPELHEGDLTSIRAAVVKGESLARFAAELGLPAHLRLSRGEEMSGARERVPILAGAFEALIGAAYLDQGIRSAQDLALRFLAPEAERVERDRLDRDAKSTLQKWVQEQWKVTPQYRLIETRGPEHAKMFVVAVWVSDEEWGRGEGRSKQLAEQSAAQNALRRTEKVNATSLRERAIPLTARVAGGVRHSE